MAYAIYAYPWAMSADHLGDTITELQQMGLDSLNLAASYHAGKFIHPTAQQRVVFPQDGCIYFQPRKEYGKLTPKVADCCAEDDILAMACADERIKVNAWTVLFHNSRLGEAHPDATVQNAWGESYPYSLCPVNPDVREYALTLCADLAEHYPLYQLLLETPGFLTYNHGYHHEFAQVEPNPWLEAWLGLCFCPHCMQGASEAGIDMQGLREHTKHTVDTFLQSDAMPSESLSQARLQADLTLLPELSALLRWRCDQVTKLVADIRATVPSRVKVKIIATTQRPHATAIWEGMDMAGLDKVCDGLELPLYQPHVSQVQADAQQVLQSLADPSQTSAILRPGWPDMQSAGQVAESIAVLKQMGIQDIGFYNLQMLRPMHLRWLAQALNG